MNGTENSIHCTSNGDKGDAVELLCLKKVQEVQCSVWAAKRITQFSLCYYIGVPMKKTVAVSRKFQAFINSYLHCVIGVL